MARRPPPDLAGARAEDPGSARQRLDKWLVYARFAKTRAAAVALLVAGRVRVNAERVARPDRAVGPGDVLTLSLAHATKVVRVVAVAQRRGPFSAAQTLYRDLAPDEGGAGPAASA